MIKNLLKRLFRPFFRNYHLTQWAKTITSSRRERKCIVSDYKRLYKIKGLTTDEYRDFLMGEVRYNRLMRENPERAEKLFSNALENAKDRYDYLTRLAAMYNND